ncbi:hypothetical protein ACFWA9_34215 [Kitasatospora sp. NPDC059973]|uniref:hypothetical protein n=1 Tax=Kitasatospora sp. NPDC059973 TaxID=3347020 RepID=UPI0036888C53
MLRMDGAWRITVIGKDAAFDQRAVVRTPYGAVVLPGRVGASLEVPAQEWELHLEHHAPGLGWRPNVRVLPGPWQASDGGLRSRVVRSKDVDWVDGDPTERNFTLRLVCLDAAAPLEEPALAPIPAATPVVRTSADPYPGTPTLAGTDRVGYRTASEDGRGSGQGSERGDGHGVEQGRAHGAGPGAGQESVGTASAGWGRGPAAPSGRGADQAAAGGEPAVAYDPWQSLPPVPEGWERVPVPLSELGPGEVPAIRRKSGQGQVLGQAATRAVPARWRADEKASVEPVALQEVLAGREPVSGVTGPQKAMRNLRPGQPAERAVPVERAMPAERVVPAERAVPVERAVPAVWESSAEWEAPAVWDAEVAVPVRPGTSAGYEAARGAVWRGEAGRPAAQEATRAVPLGHEAVRGVPTGSRGGAATTPRWTTQAGPADHGVHAERAAEVSGQEAVAGEAGTGRPRPPRPW